LLRSFAGDWNWPVLRGQCPATDGGADESISSPKTEPSWILIDPLQSLANPTDFTQCGGCHRDRHFQNTEPGELC
jgi:hypothetical protein